MQKTRFDGREKLHATLLHLVHHSSAVVASVSEERPRLLTKRFFDLIDAECGQTPFVHVAGHIAIDNETAMSISRGGGRIVGSVPAILVGHHSRFGIGGGNLSRILLRVPPQLATRLVSGLSLHQSIANFLATVFEVGQGRRQVSWRIIPAGKCLLSRIVSIQFRHHLLKQLVEGTQLFFQRLCCTSGSRLLFALTRVPSTPTSHRRTSPNVIAMRPTRQNSSFSGF